MIIITWDYEAELTVKNKTIVCIPLWKWLIANQSYLLYDLEDLEALMR
ncbi:MAG: hypothetical protein N2V78_06785 [Methanophagales archaeon]|nr:hypothetical protein [Methanophagales archaeon]